MRNKLGDFYKRYSDDKEIDVSIDDKYAVYKFKYCLRPVDTKWYVSAAKLSTADRDEFLNSSIISPFSVVTPSEGIVDSTYNAVLSWFSPNQKAKFPPFYTNDWIGPLLDSVIKQEYCSDLRTILYGTYLDKDGVFFFEPDNEKPSHTMLVFQNTILSPSFQAFADKIGARHIVNVDIINFNRVGEFIVGEVGMVQEAFSDKPSDHSDTLTYSLTNRLHSCIATFERYQDVIKRRSSISALAVDDASKETIKSALEELSLIGDELESIDPECKIDVEIFDDRFVINGHQYAYTSDCFEHLKQAIKISREKPFEKMVPRERKQAFGRFITCFLQLHSLRTPNESSDTLG